MGEENCPQITPIHADYFYCEGNTTNRLFAHLDFIHAAPAAGRLTVVNSLSGGVALRAPRTG